MTTSSEFARLCLYKDDECWVAQFAVDGRKCQPFYVHESTRRRFADETSFMKFLEHKAVEMLDLYGPVN